MAEPTLYERLGGAYAIATAVDYLVDRLHTNATLIESGFSHCLLLSLRPHDPPRVRRLAAAETFESLRRVPSAARWVVRPQTEE